MRKVLAFVVTIITAFVGKKTYQIFMDTEKEIAGQKPILIVIAVSLILPLILLSLWLWRPKPKQSIK